MNDYKAKVSVLVCVYNEKKNYLEEAMDSILNQTFSDIEIVLVDDGSTQENTVSYLNRISRQETKIFLIRNDQNQGLTKSLNIGLKHCSGKYIVRMDSDDISLKNRIEKQYDYLERHPEVCVLGSYIIKIGENTAYRKHKSVDYTDNKELFEINMLFNNVGPIHPSVMIRSDFLTQNKILYRDEIKKAQDYALWIDCMKVGGVIKNFKEPLLKYRFHPGQISSISQMEQDYYKQLLIKEQINARFTLDTDDCLEVLSTLYSEKYDFNYRHYIKCIREIIAVNDRLQVFNKPLFRRALYVRWIHKLIKCAIMSKELSGFKSLFTIRCILSKASIWWLNDILL